MNLNESFVELAALEWFGVLGNAVGHGPFLALGDPAVERDSFGEVFLRQMYKRQTGMMKS